MSSDQSSPGRLQQSGVTIALMAFMIFPFGDAIVKSMAGDWPAPAVAALRFTIGSLILGAILWRQEGAAGFRRETFSLVHVGRGLALTLATITFFSAIFIMPLAEAAAIQFVNPILTVLLSSWLLKERLSLPAWVATFLAFGGVLIMLRPNLAEFGWVAVLPLLSAVGASTIIILNRVAGASGTLWQAQFQMSLWGAIFLSITAAAGHFLFEDVRIPGPPAWHVVARCLAVAMVQSTAHFLLYLATTRATASSIAPIIYLQLIIATIISVVIFKDPVDAMSLVGGLLILASGLFHWMTSDGRHVLRRWFAR